MPSHRDPKAKKTPKSQTDSGIPFDGIRSVADMLNIMDPEARNRLLAGLNQIDPKMTDRIRDKMFVFHDLIYLSNKDFPMLIKEFTRRKLALSLRNAPEDFRAFLYKNLSSRAAETLQEEVIALGPQKLSEVTAAQNELVSLARRFLAAGLMRPPQKSDENE